MDSISAIIITILITVIPFTWYNYEKIKATKNQLLIWSILSLALSFLVYKLTNTKNHYFELLITSIAANIFNYFIITEDINIKKIPKSVGVLLLFFFSVIIQLIPIYYLHYDLNNLTSKQQLIVTCFSDSFLLITLIILYRKTFKEDFKKLKGNFYKIIDIGIKYWLIGLIIMMISNIIIGLFITQATAVNEQSVRELIKSSSLISIITIGIIGPINEELTFRKAFRDVFKNDTAFIILSGLIFGGIHVLLSLTSPWDILYVIPYSSLGIAFAKIYQQSDNIYAAIIMHIFHNTVLTTLSIIGLGVI